MLKETMDSTLRQLEERFSSPIFGSFISAWCIVNYRFLLICISSEPIENKFRLIESICFPDASTVIIKCFALPAIFSVAYIFIYPYPAEYVYKFLQKKHFNLKKIKQEFDDKIPLTEEESFALRLKLRNLNDEKNLQINQLQRENDELKNNENKVKEKDKSVDSSGEIQSSSLEKTNIENFDAREISNTLPKSQIAILTILNIYGGSATKNKILSETGVTNVELDFDLEELLRKNLLRSGYDQRASESKYYFTQAGRAVILTIIGKI